MAELVADPQAMSVRTSEGALKVFRLPQRNLFGDAQDKWRAQLGNFSKDYYGGVPQERHGLRLFFYELWLRGVRWKIPEPEFQLRA